MHKGFIMSTTNSLEGYRLEKYLGICSESVVVGAGWYSKFVAKFADSYGETKYL